MTPPVGVTVSRSPGGRGDVDPLDSVARDGPALRGWHRHERGSQSRREHAAEINGDSAHGTARPITLREDGIGDIEGDAELARGGERLTDLRGDRSCSGRARPREQRKRRPPPPALHWIPRSARKSPVGGIATRSAWTVLALM